MKNKFSTYKPAKVHTRGGDMDKEWFVEYQYYIHKTQTFKRIRETDGANRIQDPYKRKKHLDNLAKELNKKLMAGWSPISNSYEKNVIYSEDSWETCMAIVMEEKRQSTSTSHTQYKYILEYFSVYLRIRQMNTEHPRNITKSLILDYLTWRMNNFKIRRGTRDKDLIILGGAFQVLKIRGIIQTNPCYEIPRLGDRPERHEPYTAEELQRLLELLAVQGKTMLHFCIFVMAAIRPAEILRLQVKDVNLKEGVVVIKNTKSKNTYTRVARIPGILLSYLSDMPLANAPANYYIFNANGIPTPEPHANR